MLGALPYREELLVVYGNVAEHFLASKEVGTALSLIADCRAKAAGGSHLPELDPSGALGTVLRLTGDWVSAFRSESQQLAAVERIGDVRNQALVRSYLADLALSTGDLAQAEDYARSSLRLADQLHFGLADLIWQADLKLAIIALARGNHSDVLNWSRAADAVRPESYWPADWVVRSRAHLLSGDRDRAREYLLAKLPALTEGVYTHPPVWVFHRLLGCLEEAHVDADDFRAWCKGFREDYPQSHSYVTQWFLEPTVKHDRSGSSSGR